MDNGNDNAAPLPLPAPDAGPNLAGTGTDSEATKIQLGSTVKFDELGPLVVNSDGTLSRIANWQNMTELERERTLRVLSARNRARLASEEQKLQEGPAESNTSTAGETVSALGPTS